MQPELILDMDENTYHSETGLGEGLFVTRSMLAFYAKDPSAFFHRYIAKEPQMQFKDNEGTRFGSYVEAWILDRDVSMYTTKPKMCWSRNKGERVKWSLASGQFVDVTETKTTKEWMLENQNIVSEDDYELARFMEKRFRDTAFGSWWLDKIEESHKQAVVRWSEGGLNLQIRIDCYLPDVLQSDLKSTGKSLGKFTEAAEDYGYAMQQAMYSDGLALVTPKKLPFLFGVGETKNLKQARVLKLPDMQVAHARKEYKKAIYGIGQQDFNSYDFKSDEPVECELKPWQLFKYETGQ